jgi:hypothetical protein
MKTPQILTLLFLLFVVQAFAQDPCTNRTLVNSYVTSWLANDGGTQTNHIAHGMEYLAVSPDGRVATVTGWDEGGSNVMVFKDNALIKVPEGSGTGGYGRMSMIGVALDELYVYHLQSQHGCDGGNSNLNSNGLPQYPPCVDGEDNTWRTVRRYKIGSAGSNTFPNGYGYANNMMVVDTGANALVGIALSGNEIFVADVKDSSVRVYNKTTMSSVALRKFIFAGGVGQLSADNSGGIWMLQKDINKIIRFSSSTGEILSSEITFPEAAIVPSTFFVDSKRSRIVVADNGINQNIRIYTDIYTTPVFSSTFGEQYGILSGIAGKYVPGKLLDIKGVGVDSTGNIYVANSAINGGAILQAYNPAGSLLWDKKGLVFTATACADPENINEVFTFDKKISMDYSKTAPGSEWSFNAYTLNRFKYPDDPRLHGAFITSSWIKHIQGHKYLFVTDMYAGMLAGYRFDNSTDGEIAIPMLLMNIGGWDTKSNYPTNLGTDKDFIWMDKNGDGQIQQDEFTFKTGFDSPYSMAVWVDSTGNIWKGIRENGARLLPLQDVTAKGVLIYDYSKTTLLDIGKSANGLNGVKRLVYNRKNDELFVAGFSAEKPDKKSTGEGVDSWWCMGSTICKYTHVLDTLSKNPDANFKNITPAWKIFIPFIPEGDAAGSSEDDAKSFTVENGFIFVALARNGKINIYQSADGVYLTQMKPGPEVNRESGWTDIDYSINVTKTPGEYLIFNEENAFGKVLMYRIPTLETIDIYYPDASITKIEMLNSANQVVTNPKPNDVIHFRATVKNNGPGKILGGTQTTNHKSLAVSFIIKNLKTNVSLVFKADTLTRELLPGDSVQLINIGTYTPATWTVPRSKSNISARVTLSTPNQECRASNNAMNYTIATYDSAFIFTGPKPLTVLVNKPAQFSVEAYGTDPLTYKWYVNDVEQANSSNPVFTIAKATTDLNNAKIKVSVLNELRSVTSAPATLTVNDPYGPSRPGNLLREVWNNIPGTAIVDLKGSPRYPNDPDVIDFLDKFEVPTNAADDYGTKVSGWLIPPQTGDYVFYIASDDNGQLFLSSDSLKEHLSVNPIAWINDWADARVYDKYPEQTSANIYLESGKQYYAEAFFKEGGGGDNMSVAWKLPDGTKEIPIPSVRLSFNTGNGFVGLKNSTVSNNLVLYPSPANDHIFILASEIRGKSNVLITDISGRVMKSDQITINDSDATRIDVSNLKPGLYILAVFQGNKMSRAKFIVTR